MYTVQPQGFLVCGGFFCCGLVVFFFFQLVLPDPTTPVHVELKT